MGLRFGMAALAMLVGACATAAPETTPIALDVTFPSGEVVTLSAQLTKPGGVGPFPAVVLLHGCSGMMKSWGGAWSQRLADWGYVTLQVDSFRQRGHPDGVCGKGGAVGPFTRSADAHAAKAHLASLPYVDGARIGVLGMSHGGSTALWSVQNTAIVDQPRPDPFKAAVALYPGCMRKLQRLDAPLLILIGEKDDWTLARRCEAMVLAGPTRHAMTLKVYPGATHSFDVERPERTYLGHYMKHDPAAAADAFARIKAFLGQHLGY